MKPLPSRVTVVRFPEFVLILSLLESGQGHEWPVDRSRPEMMSFWLRGVRRLTSPGSSYQHVAPVASRGRPESMAVEGGVVSTTTEEPGTEACFVAANRQSLARLGLSDAAVSKIMNADVGTVVIDRIRGARGG